MSSSSEEDVETTSKTELMARILARHQDFLNSDKIKAFLGAESEKLAKDSKEFLESKEPIFSLDDIMVIERRLRTMNEKFNREVLRRKMSYVVASVELSDSSDEDYNDPIEWRMPRRLIAPRFRNGIFLNGMKIVYSLVADRAEPYNPQQQHLPLLPLAEESLSFYSRNLQPHILIQQPTTSAMMIANPQFNQAQAFFIPNSNQLLPNQTIMLQNLPNLQQPSYPYPPMQHQTYIPQPVPSNFSSTSNSSSSTSSQPTSQRFNYRDPRIDPRQRPQNSQENSNYRGNHETLWHGNTLERQMPRESERQKEFSFGSRKPGSSIAPPAAAACNLNHESFGGTIVNSFARKKRVGLIETTTAGNSPENAASSSSSVKRTSENGTMIVHQRVNQQLEASTSKKAKITNSDDNNSSTKLRAIIKSINPSKLSQVEPQVVAPQVEPTTMNKPAAELSPSTSSHLPGNNTIIPGKQIKKEPGTDCQHDSELYEKSIPIKSEIKDELDSDISNAETEVDVGSDVETEKDENSDGENAIENTEGQPSPSLPSILTVKEEIEHGDEMKEDRNKKEFRNIHIRSFAELRETRPTPGSELMDWHRVNENSRPNSPNFNQPSSPLERDDMWELSEEENVISQSAEDGFESFDDQNNHEETTEEIVSYQPMTGPPADDWCLN